MASFQEGNEDLLLQTLWPGFRHSNITHVINFEMPAMPELYMHRIRTGRADKREQQLVYCTKRGRSKSEVLMNMELAIEPFPTEVEVSA
jgi:ATP-dependent RNA helicase RhlE